jgi:diguanylate cyclase (GGDEF)-like protein
MKKLLSLVFATLACPLMAQPTVPPDITSIHAIRSLSRAQVEEQRHAVIEATVTYSRPPVHNLFVQDGDQAIFIESATAQKLTPGDRVRIAGTTHWDYNANIVSEDITVLSHTTLPKPIRANFEQLIRGQLDTKLVKVRGTVHAADMSEPILHEKATAMLKVLTDGGFIEAEVSEADPQMLKHFLDAEVEITGVDAGRFDGKRQLTGVVLRVNSLADVKAIKAAKINPWSLPVTAMDEILHVFKEKSETGRVRVSGTATYFEPGSALVLQNNAKSLWVKTKSLGPVRIGDWVEATGFPDTNNGFLVLTEGEIQDTAVAAPVKATPVASRDLRASKHIYDLISVEGEVVTETRQRSQDEYVVLAEGQVFSVIFSHRVATDSLPPLKDIPVGSRIRATGICVTEDANPFGREVPFNVLIRSTHDLEVIAPPSMLTVRNMTKLVVTLLLGLLALGARALWTGRKMRRQVAELGYLSQRRGEILEEINISRPLTEILERITELGSMSLKGAPCWCKLLDDLTLGNRPADLDTSGLRIVETPITSHSGNNLGALCSAFDARTKPRNEEAKALTTAAALATLAIETSRLHSDLVHRSEFDMLTEIQNRFAFEKQLIKLIDEASATTKMFALIYIDLNDFKQVNDRYGHQTGDLYLQKAAERMKHQLRPADMLARLGGDEFGVLVSFIHDRSEAEEITHRLERCFDEPINVADHAIRGSASIGIALYPSDGLTDDAIMSIADSDMYVKKRQNKRVSAMSAERVTSMVMQSRD